MMLSAAKRHRLHRAAQQAAEIGLGEETSVDHDFDDEQDRENAGLQNDLARACQPRRPLDAVVLAKLLALDLGFVEAAAQHEKLVAADGGFRAKIADRLRRGLLDGGKALLEAECVQPLVIGVKLVEIDDIGILLVSLDALDDLVFDVVESLRVGGRPIFRPALVAECDQAKFVGNAVDVQVEKNRGGRTIVMGRLTQQGPDARDR